MHGEPTNHLRFNASSQELSLGVELELQVLDEKTLLLAPRAAEITSRVSDAKLKLEFFQSSLEIITGICSDVHEIEKDLSASLLKAQQAAGELGLKLSSTATHPLAQYRDRLVTPSPRYFDLIDRNQWLIRRMAVYGMHIHIGMKSGDSCINYNYFFIQFLPHILALTASSPFWQSMYTGLSSCRPTVYEALPTAGMPYLVRSWHEFQKLYHFLVESKSIHSMKDLWWDLRPSPHLGTLELRFCDQPATLKEALGVIAFVHLLALWYRDHEEEWARSHTSLKQWILRENKWRAIRHGVHAEILTPRRGKTMLLSRDILHWLRILQPYAVAANYEKHLRVLYDILQKGSSSARQCKRYETTQRLSAVVEHNIAEFYTGEPLWR